MKIFLLVVNIILLVLVGYLYYLQFGSHKPVAVKDIEYVKSDDLARDSRVAYIDLDSLQNNYYYYKKIKADFEHKQSGANSEIAAMQKRYQTRAMQLQQKAPTMSQKEQEEAMQEINKMQQDMQSRKQSIDNDLYNYNSKMKEDILIRIQNYLKQYNSDGKYAYIFSYEPGFMFYKDSTLDITPDVIAGLNRLDSAINK